LAEAGVETLVIADLAEARWRKLVWNIPYNGLSVIMQCQTDRLVTDPAMRAAVRALMAEILEAAAVCGVTIEPEFIDAMEQQTEKMPPYDPSMRLDFLAGRPLEIEALYGNVIACAASQGYIMRYARLLQWQLEYLQNNR
jgi:2-dehydropantoate 2-reductase